MQYNLPFSGEWLIANGGTTKENSRSWNIFTQRYAYDFVATDKQGKSCLNEGLNLEDYHSYEKEVLSPADGVVVEIQESIKDYKGVGDYSIDWKTQDFRGNFIIIEHTKEEYSFCLLYTSPSPRDRQKSRMPSSA